MVMPTMSQNQRQEPDNGGCDKCREKDLTIERLRAALFEIADAEFSSGGRLRVMARMALRKDEG